MNAFRTDPNSAFGKAITDKLAADLGSDPIQIRIMGGTVPIIPLINELNIPTLIVPMVNMDNNQRFFITRVISHFMWRVAAGDCHLVATAVRIPVQRTAAAGWAVRSALRRTHCILLLLLGLLPHVLILLVHGSIGFNSEFNLIRSDSICQSGIWLKIGKFVYSGKKYLRTLAQSAAVVVTRTKQSLLAACKSKL